MNDIDNLIFKLKLAVLNQDIQRQLAHSKAILKRQRAKWANEQVRIANEYREALARGDAFVPAGTKMIVSRGK